MFERNVLQKCFINSCYPGQFDLFSRDPYNNKTYRQVSNIRGTLIVNEIVDNSDVVGASPVGAAPTTSSLST